jgi:hypothetical protein
MALLDVLDHVPYSAGSTPLAGSRRTHLRRPAGPPGGQGPSKIVFRKIAFFARFMTRGTFLDHKIFRPCRGVLVDFFRKSRNFDRKMPFKRDGPFWG